MDLQYIAPIFTAFALILVAIPAIIAAVGSYKTRGDVVELKKANADLHLAVNSKMDQFIALVREAALAKGVVLGEANALAKTALKAEGAKEQKDISNG